jgi:hypothetical protein
VLGEEIRLGIAFVQAGAHKMERERESQSPRFVTRRGEDDSEHRGPHGSCTSAQQ